MCFMWFLPSLEESDLKNEVSKTSEASESQTGESEE